jgi:hypothetical protein
MDQDIAKGVVIITLATAMGPGFDTIVIGN